MHFNLCGAVVVLKDAGDRRNPDFSLLLNYFSPCAEFCFEV
ncbi:hypothetical protein [Anabaenopsis arnoldii]|nr:hypothetical protein [Anabaenopsis arnoldii]MDH6093008.1 hypothetical protein [Anabaenopsis arnoldii]